MQGLCQHRAQLDPIILLRESKPQRCVEQLSTAWLCHCDCSELGNSLGGKKNMAPQLLKLSTTAGGEHSSHALSSSPSKIHPKSAIRGKRWVCAALQRDAK